MALARLKHGRIDAIVLDLNLPDSTGLTTFLRVQPKAPQVPIVVLVGEDDEDTGADAVSRGALDSLRRDDLTSQLIEKVLRYATERTHTLLALKASEQRYRELFQNVTAGVFQTTTDGKFMAANPALVRMLGYASEDELLELDVARDIYMDPEHRENWIKTMVADGEVRNAELVLKRKDGSKIVVLENSRAVTRCRRPRDFLRRHADRHHRGARAVAAAVVRREPRPADGAGQSPRVRAEAAAGARDDAGDRGRARGAVPRSRPVQERQRHLRSRRRR